MKKEILFLILSCAISQTAHSANLADTVTKIDIEEVDGIKRINRTDTTYAQTIDSFVQKGGYQVYGETKLSNGTIGHELRASGDIAYDNLVVKSHSYINGALSGKNGTFCDLVVMGPVNVKNTRVAGKLEVTGNVELLDSEIDGATNIIGNLKARNAKFLQAITVTGSKIKLKNSYAKNIHIKNNMNLSQVQTLYIGKGTVVKGMINFESGNGLVVDDSNRILAAQVKGAIIEKR